MPRRWGNRGATNGYTLRVQTYPRATRPPAVGRSLILRLFVGLQVPDTWTRAVDELVALLPVPARSLIETVAPQRLHVTLRFVGECSGATAVRLGRELDGIGSIDVTVELAEPGTFTTATGELVVWLGVHGPQLLSLTERIDQAISRLPIPERDHPFVGHMSVAHSVRTLSRYELRYMEEMITALPSPPRLSARLQSAFLFDTETADGDAYRVVSTLGRSVARRGNENLR